MMVQSISICAIFLASLLFADDGKIFHVSIDGTIDMGLPHYIKRVVKSAEEENASVIIFEIDTFGGRVDAATQIKDIILDSKVTTIAFINKRAISAGALISLSCDSIFMASGASIGAATAVNMKGEKASEKIISYMREEMASTAEAKKRSRKIATAMVDEDLAIKFITNSRGDTITSKDIEGFLEGKLITLSTKLAIKSDIADKEISDMADLLLHLNLKNTEKITTKESWSEMLVRFLTNPVVAPLFMSLGMLGIFIEIKSPGFGFPGAIGLICMALFFGSHLLVGLADITEFLILFSGIILILLELLVIPGFGVAGISGICLCLFAFYKMLIGDFPSPGDYQSAYLGISFGITTAFIGTIIIFKTFPNTKLYKKFIPFTPQKSSDGYSISKGFEKLVGESGKCITDLRPSGKVDINGIAYQALSHGDYIEKDEIIIVDGVDENQLFVKKV